MVRQQYFVSAVLLFVVVFAAGILVGRNFSNPELSEVAEFIKHSELTTESYLLEQELLSGIDRSCELAQRRLAALSLELWQLGKLLGSETAQQDLGAADYHFLKRKFHLMQIKTYLLYFQLRQDCQLSTPVVLFYYRQDDAASREQGAILDRLVTAHNLTVFAIEHAYSDELRFLEDYYEVEATPAVVINYETVRQGLTPYEEIQALLRP
jgi:hypothetical protein